MEEDNIELIDYIRTINKRKILIIVGTLVCIVVGVVMDSRQSLPSVYHSDAILRVSSRVELGPPPSDLSSFTSALVSSDNLIDLASSIPIKFGQNIKKVSGFNLEAKVIEGTTMIRITLKGPDGRTEKFLKELINNIIHEHREITEASISHAENIIDNLKTKVEEFVVGIAVTKERLQKARSMEKEIRIDLSKAKTSMSNAKSVDIDIALLEIAYDKVSNLEKELEGDRSRLGALQKQLITNQTFLSNLKGYGTELIEKVENSTINPKRKRVLLVAGIAGLIISLSLAFFIEYLGNVSEDRRRKNG
jgi:uncharacterized protein involved in exopolysaccharide biosynthesis